MHPLELIGKAENVARNAYAPFSGFRVGAALLTEQGNVFVGCNVENRSYGLTMCAERSAIFAAIAQEGPSMKIAYIAVLVESKIPFPPCGACLQVIQEFSSPATQVGFYRDAFLWVPLSQLLPSPF